MEREPYLLDWDTVIQLASILFSIFGTSFYLCPLILSLPYLTRCLKIPNIGFNDFQSPTACNLHKKK